MIINNIENNNYPCLSARGIRSCQFWAGGSLLFFSSLCFLYAVFQRFYAI